jgi:membrane protein involved in colicin uptake
MEYEPLLPVEKRLIAWSLVLGVVLIGILVWVSQTFFEVKG